MGTIVVGVDGSDASRRALDWAVQEAAYRGWDVRAVYVWRHGPPRPWIPGPGLSWDELEADAQRVLDRVVDSTDTRGLRQPVERIVCEGSPPHVLAEYARGADLMVVGARGLGAMSRWLLGSVSEHVVRHAECPVLIVRAGDVAPAAASRRTASATSEDEVRGGVGEEIYY